jgi:hypothetical protein
VPASNGWWSGPAVTLGALVDRGADLVIGDFVERDAVRPVAVELHDGRPLDAVIHNGGVWSGPAVTPVNTIAPYLLTDLLPEPRRLVYLRAVASTLQQAVSPP